DLELLAVGGDAEVFAAHAVHLDAHDGLVVGDDVDVAGDEADPQGADAVHLDRLGPVDEPLLLTHGGLLSRVISRVVEDTLYRVIPRTQGDSRSEDLTLTPRQLLPSRAWSGASRRSPGWRAPRAARCVTTTTRDS